MRTATTLLVRTAPEPRWGDVDVCDGQAPLPLASLPYAPVALVQTTPPQEATDLRRRSARFVQVLVEVLSGERPVRQLATWTAPDVYAQLAARLEVETLSATRHGRRTIARLASVHMARVSDEAVEIAARLVHQGRSRAVAVRLELGLDHRGVRAWICTALVWA